MVTDQRLRYSVRATAATPAAILWSLRSPAQHITECALLAWPGGEYQLHVTHPEQAGSLPAVFTTEMAAMRAASALADAMKEDGWTDIASTQDCF